MKTVELELCNPFYLSGNLCLLYKKEIGLNYTTYYVLVKNRELTLLFMNFLDKIFLFEYEKNKLHGELIPVLDSTNTKIQELNLKEEE